MRTIIPFRNCFAILLIAISLVLSLQVRTQNIQIDSTFNSDGEIYPFQEGDTIYGLSITGSVELLTDTSLVRVILSDEAGNEWMIYESYPLIAENSIFDIVNQCDETCFLDSFIPVSLQIQIHYAFLNIDSLLLKTAFEENTELLQFQAKRAKDLEKIDIMNQRIDDYGWDWTAGDNECISFYYKDKKNLFHCGKYNTLGFEYYIGGFYRYISAYHSNPVPSSLIDSFDWRDRHDARYEESLYFDSDHEG